MLAHSVRSALKAARPSGQLADGSRGHQFTCASHSLRAVNNQRKAPTFGLWCS
nr:MAG TPA: hypothetical protein [Caudoviricetes sp.]